MSYGGACGGGIFGAPSMIVARSECLGKSRDLCGDNGLHFSKLQSTMLCDMRS